MEGKVLKRQFLSLFPHRPWIVEIKSKLRCKMYEGDGPTVEIYRFLRLRMLHALFGRRNIVKLDYININVIDGKFMFSFRWDKYKDGT